MHPEEQLSAYMDGELDDAERLEIELHLEHCPSCRLMLNEFMELKQTFSTALFEFTAPAGLEIRILQALAHENKIRNLGKLWLLVPLLAAMVFVLLAIVAGPVAVPFMHGALVIGRGLLYMMSHAVSHMPIVSCIAVVLSLGVLVASILSLRRLLQSAAVENQAK